MEWKYNYWRWINLDSGAQDNVMPINVSKEISPNMRIYKTKGIIEAHGRFKLYTIEWVDI